MIEPYKKNASSDVILADLQKLQDTDRMIEGKMKVNKIGAWISGASVLIGFFIMQASEQTGGVFLAIAVIALVYFLIVYNIWAGRDIENRRFLIPMRMFSILSEDMKSDKPCGVSIDFSGYRKHGRMVKRDVQKSFLAYPVTYIRYVDNWFGASGKLADGCRFKMKIVQDIHRTEKQKRKYTKVKEKISEEAVVYLRPDPAIYPNFASILRHLPAGVPGEIAVNVTTEGSLIKLSAVTGEYVKITGRQDAEINRDALFSGDDLLRLFVYLYTGLQHCRG